MGKDKRRVEQNRAKKRARQAARRKQTQQGARHGVLAELGLTRAEVDRAPVLAAYASKSLFERGLGYVLVAREVAGGQVLFGSFLVDVFCLGVKDAFLSFGSSDEFEETVETRYPPAELQKVTGAYARKLVDGAVAFAADLGFEPHRDYRSARFVLGGIDPAECPEEFAFGQNGKPHYISGPLDSPGRITRIVTHLRHRFGPDGAHFTVGVDDPSALGFDEEDVEDVEVIDTDVTEE